jgi:RimJ/RimL family protein N-acetyltransferase
MLGPVIEGERIRLEPPRPEFIPAYQRWFADREVTRYLRYRTPLTAKQQEQWLEDRARDEHGVLWTIVVKENGRPIGNTALERIDWRNRRAESGTVIGERDEWGKGYATEAMRLRTRYAFRELGLEKLYTAVFLPNDASRRALERAGYRQCGLHRRHLLVDGRWHDAWLGEILRDEWEALQEEAAP